MPNEHVETLIIGGGQAGLAMSGMLSRRSLPHLIVERHRIAERWRSERWNGLRLQFPNWSIRLPGYRFEHADPNGFATSNEIVDFLAAYAAHIEAPVRSGVRVIALRQRSGGPGFVAETSAGAIEAGNVVIATGPYQRPVIPDFLAGNNRVFQIHANAYREPDQLPAGSVLIVGSGASGTQIAEELQRAGRRVFLSVGRHKRVPRRYRGQDVIWWLSELGLDQTTAAERGPDKTLALITGAYGGHTIDFRKLAGKGITLLGRVAAATGDTLAIEPGLSATLAAGDKAYFSFLDIVDKHVQKSGLDDAPPEPGARIIARDPACVTAAIAQLDLKKEGITSVIWATGYTFDFGWIDLPVFDSSGEPKHRDGVTDVPGLYFLGLPWLSRMSSSFLSGVGDDAAALAEHIARK
ncbi:MAG TPA: NAD(P)/FAD-dependent oxidoreductase [Bradyrhizobium sp.]|nr:NAD(P)/FAD-dependent oxidoreductase [Bradyrhizobium sp.]